MNTVRASREFELHAKESVDVEEISGTLYAFGSELACLRLFHAYRNCMDRVATGFSVNMNTWYFRLEEAV